MKKINSFDMDGVLTVGLYPNIFDIVITGRSLDEFYETNKWLRNRGIHNVVHMNPCRFEEKTRESSGKHKARVLTIYHENDRDVEIVNHFEDDEIQADIIEKLCPWVNIVRIVHDLTEKENVRHYEE